MLFTHPVLRSFTRPPWPWLFAVAGAGLVLSAFGAGHASLAAWCGTIGGLAWAAHGPALLEATLMLHSPLSFLREWALMLVAMMPPLLAMPLMHVWRSSLPRRRARAAAGFLAGYVAAWMAAGPLLMGLAFLLQLVLAGYATTVSLLLAVLWSMSPWQRGALNRGHRLRRIGLFGWAADRDCLAFGATHGGWCIASCWAWMVLPMMAGQWHVAVMLLAGAVMLAERLSMPSRPRWRLPAIVPRVDLRALFARRMASPHG